MESFFRYISYADYYEKGLRLHNAGFLRWKMQKNIHRLDLEIKDLHGIEGCFFLVEEASDKRVAPIELKKGQGSLRLCVEAVKKRGREYLQLTHEELDLYELKAFRMDLGDDRVLRIPVELPLTRDMEAAEAENVFIGGIEEKYEQPQKEQEVIHRPVYVEHKEEPERIARPTESEKIVHEPLKEDKWQQLCNHYPHVHPFNSGRTFLSIRPEDFIILQEQYQRLVHNSFLLHGYYNYKHMILGKLEEDPQKPYYIGVPGVFYEKERQAAGLFGFAGFEGVEIPVKNGSYGYYMIEVKI